MNTDIITNVIESEIITNVTNLDIYNNLSDIRELIAILIFVVCVFFLYIFIKNILRIKR